MNVSSQSRVRNLEWALLKESHVLLKHVYLKLFFPTEVAVRKFSEKIGGIMFLMELVLYVLSGPVRIWWFLTHFFRTGFTWALFEIGWNLRKVMLKGFLRMFGFSLVVLILYFRLQHVIKQQMGNVHYVVQKFSTKQCKFLP